MRVATLLREARRRHGMSIRAASMRCGVPTSTWADWETGRSSPPADRLDEVLTVLRLDLRLVQRIEEPPGELAVVRHLRQSLTQRALAALGEQLEATLSACRSAPRLLTGAAAAGIWVPYVVAHGPLPLPPARAAAGLVQICLSQGDGRTRTARAWVQTPAGLLFDGLADRWPSLLTSARLLAENAPRDVVGRQLPAHRDPDEDREVRDLAVTLTWGGRGRMPVSPEDSRAWRLDAPATLDEALTRQRLPARNGSRRGGARRV